MDPLATLSQLTELHQRRTLRALRPHSPHFALAGSQKLFVFSSNDYLGLSQHPAVIAAAQKALSDYGAGSRSSRLLSGSWDLHHHLEESLAAAKKTEAALVFSSGYAMALGAILTIVGKGDLVIADKLCHASLLDGAKLSGATLRIFPHNRLSSLEKLLSKPREPKPKRVLILAESVYSMDGDVAPLAELVALKKRHGALLFLDEAHGLGVLGPSGMGLAEQLNLSQEVDFQAGTLSKAVGSAGGFVATSQAWVDLMVNRSRSFIYSTAPPPSQSAASLTSLKLIRSQEGADLRARLTQNISTLKSLLPSLDRSSTPIQPLIVGSSQASLEAAAHLEERGFLIPAVRYPTVPRNQARLRITLTADHTTEQLTQLSQSLTPLIP